MRVITLWPVLALAVSVQAQVFNQPQLSNTRITFSGTPTAEGIAGFLDWPNPLVFPSTGGADRGHILDATVVKNFGPGEHSHAYYYLTGRDKVPMGGGTGTAHAAQLNGMAATTAYLAGGGNLGSLEFFFGEAGNDRTKTWNLGADQLNQNWFASAASQLEYRVYQANPADISWGISYQDTPILAFDYSPLYMTVDYGATTAGGDDAISGFSDPVPAQKQAGLNAFNDGLADALLADIAAGGGKVQLNAYTIQPATREDFVDSPYLYGVFGFDGAIQAVPEPQHYAMIFAGLALVGTRLLRRAKAAAAASRL